MHMAEHSPLTGWLQSAIRSAFWQVPASLLIAVFAPQANGALNAGSAAIAG